MEPNSNRLYALGGQDTNSSNSSAYSLPRAATPSTRKVIKMGGSLEIIEGSDSGMCGSSHMSPGNSRPPSNASSRSRGSVGSVPPRADSSMSRRVNTPTKQITLQAVRRKEESSEPFVDHVDWQSLSLNSSHRKTWEREETDVEKETAQNHFKMDQFRQESETNHATKLRLPQPERNDENKSSQMKHHPDDGKDKINEISSKEMNGDQERKDDDNDKEEAGDDEDDSDSSDEEEEPLKAPNELLMEFVDCLMKKDFQNASKLCKMILLYEPENAEALKFQPLIEEKLALDAEAEKEAAEGSDEDDEDDSDDDEDDSDDDDDDDDSSSDDDEDDDDEDDDAGPSNNLHARNNAHVENGRHHHPFCRQDSGIASETET